MAHYGTLSGAGDYHEARGNSAWSASAPDPMPVPPPPVDPSWHTDAERTAALVRASATIDGMYGARFPGKRAGGRAQKREWPRESAVDQCTDEAIPSDEVPDGVEDAVYALALTELITPGSSSPSFTPGNVMKREKVDVLERERFGPNDGVNFSLGDMRTRYAEVEDHLRCLLKPEPRGGLMFGKAVRG